MNPAPKETLRTRGAAMLCLMNSPDALLSQILMASTYPVEVVEAERWSTRGGGGGHGR
jgi:hypothetical protein